MNLIARRGGRGIIYLIYFLFRGVSSGEPVPITIAVVLAIVIFGSMYFKFRS